MSEILQHFEAAEALILDVDGTVYGGEFFRSFTEVTLHNTARKCRTTLGISMEQAKDIAWKYYKEYGSTAAGMWIKHGTDPKAFFEGVCDGLSYNQLKRDDRLSRSLSAFKNKGGRVIVFTSAQLRHASIVLEKVGISGLVDDFFGAEKANYRAKVHPDIQKMMLDTYCLKPQSTVFCDDGVTILATAKSLGAGTVLVSPEGPPSEQEAELPYIDHRTHDLPSFISNLTDGANHEHTSNGVCVFTSRQE